MVVWTLADCEWRAAAPGPLRLPRAQIRHRCFTTSPILRTIGRLVRCSSTADIYTALSILVHLLIRCNLVKNIIHLRVCLVGRHACENLCLYTRHQKPLPTLSTRVRVRCTSTTCTDLTAVRVPVRHFSADLLLAAILHILGHGQRCSEPVISPKKHRCVLPTDLLEAQARLCARLSALVCVIELEGVLRERERKSTRARASRSARVSVSVCV